MPNNGQEFTDALGDAEGEIGKQAEELFPEKTCILQLITARLMGLHQVLGITSAVALRHAMNGASEQELKKDSTHTVSLVWLGMDEDCQQELAERALRILADPGFQEIVDGERKKADGNPPS